VRPCRKHVRGDIVHVCGRCGMPYGRDWLESCVDRNDPGLVERAFAVAIPSPHRTTTRETETSILRAIHSALNRTNHTRVMRNNVGKLQDARGRWVTYGLGIGSADLVGVVKTPSGTRPLAIEVKASNGHTTKEQRAWLAVAKKWGVVCGVARSVEEAMAIVEQARGTKGGEG
jgi:hypothetical protein